MGKRKAVRNRREERRAFWFGMGIGLFVFVTLAGLVVVDYQGTARPLFPWTGSRTRPSSG